MPQEATGGSGATAARRYESTALRGANRAACTKLRAATGLDKQQSTAEPISSEQTGSNASRGPSQANSISRRAQHAANLADTREPCPRSGAAATVGRYRDARSAASAERCH